MANPTTNYGFVLPTPTDLVTDLPADFDVALQGVDTRLKALQPGTTLGDLAYSSATANTNTRLGIGTTGQVLTVASGVASWATPTASTAGLNLISPTSIAFTGTSASTTNGKTVFSACSSLSLNGVFTSSYDNYLILFAPVSQSTDIAQFMRLRASGTDTSTGYNNSAWYQNAGGTWNNNPDTTDAILAMQTGTNGGTCVMNIQNPNLANRTFVNAQRAITAQGSGTVASQSGTTQFDGFTLYQTSGNATGTIRVYGIRNGG